MTKEQLLKELAAEQRKETAAKQKDINAYKVAVTKTVNELFEPLEEVSKAIIQSNVKLLESVKGIGKKTAERLVLELKDKLSKQSLNETISPGWSNSLEQDALNALVALGISRQQAEQAIQKVTLAEPSVHKLEDLLKKALKTI